MRKKNKRYDWLMSMISAYRYQVGAEIGCAQGFTTGRLLRYCHGLKTLYAVDLWDKAPMDSVRDDSYDTWDFKAVQNRFREQTRFNTSKMKVLKGVTWEMAQHVSDNSLDFVFIDAGHTYECVKKDIIAWTPKLKKNGMISGHDINIVDGVLKAVTELIPNFKDSEVDHCWFARKEDVKCQ